ncbi:MAG: LysE/ArgO family amino acid transporter [Microbacteriaceae bacterium]
MPPTEFVVALLTGFGAGASLIIAIGAQNAFVLRQGIRREHVWPIVLVCALSDIVLILAGVVGVGVIVSAAPIALDIVRWAGAAFLVGYAVLAGVRAVRPQSLEVAPVDSVSLRMTIVTALALTWLNPHVYLDTVVLLGSIANAQGEESRWIFAIGACLASLCWFVALGFGARVIAPLFRKPTAWRILDGCIAVIMLWLAVSLIARP